MAMLFNSMRATGARSVAVAKPYTRRFSGDYVQSDPTAKTCSVPSLLPCFKVEGPA